MKNIESFHNILLMSLADGELAEGEKKFINDISYQLGITDEEYSYLIKSVNSSSQFLVPNNKDEAYNEMYKMIFLALSDGHLSVEEENVLYDFGMQAGFTRQECVNIINYVYEKHNMVIAEVVEHNKQECDKVLGALRALGKTDAELATIFHEIIKSKNIELTKFTINGVDINLTDHEHFVMCAWLWLVECRYMKIYDIGLVMVAMNIELIKAGTYTLNDLFIDIKLAEDMETDSTRLAILDSPIEAIKKELRNNFPFNQSNQ